MRFLFLTGTVLVLYFQPLPAQKKKNIPPGTVKVNDTLFTDRTEVTNIGWREYLYFLYQFDSASLTAALPDTSVWTAEDLRAGDIFVEYYLRHPMFNIYPVVGISYEQANAFCRWRTWSANFAVYIRENNINDWQNHINDTFRFKFYYRLPTAEEWEALAHPSIDTASGFFRKYSGKNRYFFNTKEYNKAINTDTSGAHHYREYTYCVPAGSFFPGRYKTYNLFGNVAEMTSEKGIAKGGSFTHTLEESDYKKNQQYTRPECWLGFRCVAVLLK